MKVRNLDKNGDWTFGQSTSNYARNAYAVALDIKMKLREWYGDCFFALQNGIPYPIRLGSHNQKNLMDTDIYNIAASVTGVIRIFNFKSSLIGRVYQCSFNVYQQYSTETLNIEFDTQQINNF